VRARSKRAPPRSPKRQQSLAITPPKRENDKKTSQNIVQIVKASISHIF
jgi:hypothetical protein